MALLCQLQHLNLHYGQKVIFDNAQFVLHTQEIIGLIGLNGRGKSTLLRILAGEVSPDQSTPPFQFDKAQSKNPEQGFSVFHVPQELPHTENCSIEEYLFHFHPNLKKIHHQLQEIALQLETHSSESLLNQQQELLSQWELKDGWGIQRSYEGLIQFLLGDRKKELMDQLSGGEQRKVALALGLSAKSQLILWDEPTNHLDVEAIEWLEKNLLQSDKSHVIVSHDRYLLSRVCDRIFHIQDGQVNVYQGQYQEYVEFLKEKKAQQLKQLEKLGNRQRQELAWMRQGVKARGTRSKKRVERFHQLQKELQQLKNSVPEQVQFSMQASGRKTKILVEAKELSFHYPEQDVLFDKIDFILAKEKKIALLGANGVGKTTLVKLMMGQLKASSGDLRRAQDLQIGYFDQKKQQLNPEMTAFDVVGEGEQFVSTANGGKQHVYSYMENFLFSAEELNRPVSKFSGGEKNRLQLALFMKRPADIWIFDEPTNDLDIETISILEQEIENFKGAVLLISHDRAFIDNIAQECWLLHRKKLTAFIGGFHQVEAYYHSLQEEQIEEGPVKAIVSSREKSKKPSYKQKQRWKLIESEIESCESEIERYKNDIASFDYSSMDRAKQEQLDQLNNQLSSAESHLDQLMHEWEELAAFMS
jgi:ATP-binding cassette subfamily F protein uup